MITHLTFDNRDLLIDYTLSLSLLHFSSLNKISHSFVNVGLIQQGYVKGGIPKDLRLSPDKL